MLSCVANRVWSLPSSCRVAGCAFSDSEKANERNVDHNLHVERKLQIDLQIVTHSKCINAKYNISFILNDNLCAAGAGGGGGDIGIHF